jgi:hypothetical protein
MRDDCIAVQGLLLRRKTIRMQDLADELGMNQRTARRWVESFGLVMDIRVDRGVVIVGEGS